MKSGKQRKAEIKAARLKRSAGLQDLPERLAAYLSANVVACNPAQLAPSNSYGAPEFVHRGYYVDTAFRCKECGAEGIWTAARQKWWYEVAKGNVETRAVRCKACRAHERARKAIARQIHQAGLLAKRARAQQ
jgi:hypothetical protein